MLRRSLVSLASITLTISGLDVQNTCSTSETTCEGLQAFSPKEFKTFPIKNIKQLSHNTKLYEIQLPSDQHVTGMTAASLIMVQGFDKEGKIISRPYTPTLESKGTFELIIKNYPDGNVSNYLGKLRVGDLIEVKGPISKFTYEANMKRCIGMIAGGTGITPMLQIIREILKNSDDKTLVTLIFANHKEEDILARNTLDVMEATHSNLKVIYVVSQPSDNWSGHSGRINLQMLKKHLPAPASDVGVYVCGPPSFMNDISGGKTPDYKQGPVAGYLKELGYDENMVFKF
jgi:cytochrome-b5 reductase